jgi:hypothetical protein
MRQSRVQSRNQIFFPDLAIKLPNAEATEDDNPDKREHRRVKYGRTALAW